MTILPAESITRRKLQTLDSLPLVARNNTRCQHNPPSAPSIRASWRTPT